MDFCVMYTKQHLLVFLKNLCYLQKWYRAKTNRYITGHVTVRGSSPVKSKSKWNTLVKAVFAVSQEKARVIEVER